MSRTELDEARKELERLQAQITEQGSRVRLLESGEKMTPAALLAGRTQSRRDLLRLAGAAGIAAAGAVGMGALNARPVHATTGGNMILGASNTAEAATVLDYDGGTQGDSILTLSTASSTATNVHGLSIGAKGNALDIKLAGTGRLGQLSLTSVNSVGPALSTGIYHEMVRGNDGSMWATRGNASSVGAGLPGAAAWKRMNTWRVDKGDGSGAPFAPVRIVNTADGTGGVSAPLQPNTTTPFGSFLGTNGIPTTATGIFGNVTAFAYNGQGFLTVFPAGITQPNVSTVNFGGGVYAWGNHFVTAFGTGANAGKFSIYNSNNVGTMVIVDVFGYIE